MQQSRSYDKSSYVRIVAENIKKEIKIFDEETFEEGMSPLEEIKKGLDETSLFVFFISNNSLDSKWVKSELTQAKSLLDLLKIERIYPIIIEHGITHNDPRIPQWMRDSLNIQPILKPTIAARKINSRLTEISWNIHPKLKERKEIFVGRNDLVKEVEQRLDDFAKQTPIALIASGLPCIGRKSLLGYSFRKANLVRDSYEFPIISLGRFDGIEDFIIKLCDLGLVFIPDLKSRLTGTFSQKIELAKEIVISISEELERVLIEDRGVLVQDNGEIVDWFVEVISEISDRQHLLFGIASSFRVKRELNRVNPLFYAVSVAEMELEERNGLLVRYSKFQNVALSKDDYSFFADLLTGYPEQVLFAVDMLHEQGLFKAKKNSHIIQQYGSDKAKVVIDGFKKNKDTLDFIYFLSRFEFISYEVLFDIVDEAKYFPILDELLSSSVCERMGVSADYIRLNEVIRDYVSRSNFGLPIVFEDSIKKHITNFLEKYEDDSSDISDYIFSAQQLLLSGKKLPDDMIIPSVFIKTIKKLYDQDRNYKESILLADRVLLKERYLHRNTIEHIRFIKCQSLARLKDSEFFAEVQKVSEQNKLFLQGFYYRLSGNYSKALESLNRLLDKGRRDPKVVGELVLVYMQNDEFNLAYDLAKESYKSRNSNIINANNYFACLIMRDKNDENKKELNQIIKRLEIDPSDRAQEMLDSAKARLMAYYDNDEHGSLSLIEETIMKFPKVDYPVLTKAELSAHFRNKIKLREAVNRLEREINRNAQTYRTFIRYKAICLAMEGELYQAKQLVDTELRGLIGVSLKRLHERLEYYSPK